MKVLIIGGAGMLGHKLVQRWSAEFEVTATFRGRPGRILETGIYDRAATVEGFDVRDAAAVRKLVRDRRPDVIVNAAGIIKQRPSGSDVVETLTVNSIFPHILAEVAGDCGARMIGISTDCVFDGRRGGYTEADASDAADLYGRSKSLGEVTEGNCLTVRTSIIGRELADGHSLVEWFLANRGKRVRGFVNAIYTGFPTLVLADILAGIIRDRPGLRGLYHVSSEKINKFELLLLLNREFGAGAEIEPDPALRIDRSLDSTRFRRESGFVPEDWGSMVRKLAEDGRIYDKWRL